MLFLKRAVLVLSVIYPFLVYWGLSVSQSQFVFPLILVLIGLRWIVSGPQERKVLVATALIIFIIGFSWGGMLSLKFYPVLMNAGLLFIFLSSLYFSPTAVEKIARLTNKADFDADAILYMRKVTWVWSAFFFLNTCFSAYTAIWGSEELWVLYNGMIAYLLVGCLFAVEWIVRQKVMRR